MKTPRPQCPYSSKHGGYPRGIMTSHTDTKKHFSDAWETMRGDMKQEFGSFKEEMNKKLDEVGAKSKDMETRVEEMEQRVGVMEEWSAKGHAPSDRRGKTTRAG